MKRALILCALIPSLASAYQISTIKVGGEKQAEIHLDTSAPPEPQPQIEIKERGLSLTFPSAELNESFGGRLVLKAPHTLVSELIADAPQKGVVRVQVTIAGGVDRLKERVSVETNPKGATLRILPLALLAAKPVETTPIAETAAAPPVTRAPAATDIMNEEQLPIGNDASSPKVAGPHYHFRDLMIMLVLFVAAGFGSAAFVKFLKRKGGFQGSRRYLIEQLSYCSLGNKSGVSLLKIGTEFVLVGVTPEQVTFLSSLPKLEAQYQDEAQFERGAFKEAVHDELSRLQDGPRVVS